jgi:hypothetical protein
MSDNSVKPSKSLLVYHVSRGEKSVMVGLDNYYIQNELKKYHGSYSYIMTVNGVSLDATGNILKICYLKGRSRIPPHNLNIVSARYLWYRLVCSLSGRVNMTGFY